MGKKTYTTNLNSKKFNSIQEVEEYAKSIGYWISAMNSEKKGNNWVVNITLSKLI